MGETTAISWSDHTFNPWWGCTKVSAAWPASFGVKGRERAGAAERT